MLWVGKGSTTRFQVTADMFWTIRNCLEFWNSKFSVLTASLRQPWAKKHRNWPKNRFLQFLVCWNECMLWVSNDSKTRFPVITDMLGTSMNCLDFWNSKFGVLTASLRRPWAKKHRNWPKNRFWQFLVCWNACCGLAMSLNAIPGHYWHVGNKHELSRVLKFKI